jgi:hypothetical protein
MRSRREKEKKIELRHGEECRDLRLGRFREKKENKFLTFFFFCMLLWRKQIYIYIYIYIVWGHGKEKKMKINKTEKF